MKKEPNIKAAYEIPDAAEVPVECGFVVCLSDGENEDTGEEPWN